MHCRRARRRTGNCKTVADLIGRLVQSVRASMANPSSQLGLINASQAIIQPCGKMISASKAAVATVGDQATALQLANFAKQTATCLADLRTAAAKVRAILLIIDYLFVL